MPSRKPRVQHARWCGERTRDHQACTHPAVGVFEVVRPGSVAEAVLCRPHWKHLRSKGYDVERIGR